MSATSKIEWTDATWNPVTGCTKVSPGCDHCYAEGIATRFRGPAFPNGFDVTLRENRLREPLHWREPRRVFVNSMSDLFHDAISDVYIAKVFSVMAFAQAHTFQVLTKRHGRMRALLSSPDFWTVVGDEMSSLCGARCAPLRSKVLPNVWLGVSVEDQKWADIRIPALLDTPAAVRFLSCEPLLGPVELHRLYRVGTTDSHVYPLGHAAHGIGWVIVGGESGAGARPMAREFAQMLRDECNAAGVAFFFKQWGNHDEHGNRMAKHAAGRLLDGQTWDEYPQAAMAS